MTIRVPENLNLDVLIDMYSDSIVRSGLKINEELKDRMAYFCHSLHGCAASHKDYLEQYLTRPSNARPYYPMKSTILQASLGKDYKVVIDVLVLLGVIDKDDSYSVGRYSKSFRFTDTYYGVRWVQYEIGSYIVQRAVKKSIKVFEEKADSDNREYPAYFLTKFLKASKLKIDTSQAMKWVYDNEQYELKNNPGEAKNIIEKHEQYRTCIESINVSSRYSFDEFSGRLHTVLTNLKKELRQFVTYDGKPLVSIDIKNSQPYFSTLLFNADFWAERRKNTKITSYRKIGIERKEIEEKGYTIMLGESSVSQYSKGFTNSYFCAYAVSGTLYEEIEKQLGWQYPDRMGNRELAKKEVLRWMYYDKNRDMNSHTSFYDPTRAIGDLFPGVTKMFDTIKAYEEKLLPRLLQRLECHLVLEVVCKHLHKSLKSIPLFTIHDSIVTTKEHVDVVESMIKDVLTDSVSFPPKLAIEYWQGRDEDVSQMDVNAA